MAWNRLCPVQSLSLQSVRAMTVSTDSFVAQVHFGSIFFEVDPAHDAARTEVVAYLTSDPLAAPFAVFYGGPWVFREAFQANPLVA